MTSSEVISNFIKNICVILKLIHLAKSGENFRRFGQDLFN